MTRAFAKSETPSSFSFSLNTSIPTVPIIATAIGIIIIAVAVFEIQSEMKAVAIIKPRMICFGLVPVRRIIVRAILRCRFHFCMAAAMINPPRKRKMVLSA
ncbi:MAG: hypothetical protein BWY45_00585 [Euryarchaeota archaeon ADurb.Bin294]|nr:MAG: hypothetical protein BWY45_00585 [Euryarchaeota archaeon ADurb.Bin294]